MFAGEKMNSGPLTNQRNFGTWLMSQKCCDIFIQSSIGSNFSSLIVLKMKPDLYSFISGGLESAEAHAFTGLKKNKKLATWMPYFWFFFITFEVGVKISKLRGRMKMNQLFWKAVGKDETVTVNFFSHEDGINISMSTVGTPSALPPLPNVARASLSNWLFPISYCELLTAAVVTELLVWSLSRYNKSLPRVFFFFNEKSHAITSPIPNSTLQFGCLFRSQIAKWTYSQLV